MTIRFAAIGFAHNHIYNQVNALLAAGATLTAFYDEAPEQRAVFAQRYPHATEAVSIDAILDDESIQLIISAIRPDQRAGLGITAMQHGKDYLCAKPAFTTLEQVSAARKVQAETQRIFAVYFGERFGNPATVKADELVLSGQIGQVVQTVGFGPHRLLGHTPRPDWAFDRRIFGGILNDLASHQIDQFLFFTQQDNAEIVSAHVGNFKHPQFANFHDYGDLTLRTTQATAHIRVDWLTAQGLNTWGDVRLFILGTDGHIELRKNIDLAGRTGDNHLFMVNHAGTEYIPCADIPLPFASQLIADIHDRTQTTAPQEHYFITAELALKAEAQATDLTHGVKNQ
jgi:predicted dehydrogenase